MIGPAFALADRKTTMTTIKITMSEQAPISIDADKWPIIARSGHVDGSDVLHIVVRQHSDSRRVVYCQRNDDMNGTTQTLGGYLLTPRLRPGPGLDLESETVRAIRRCAGIIRHPEVGDRCIADLPAVEI
jgi:hypothetical protein